MELLLGLDRRQFEPTVCCLAQPGALAPFAQRAGIVVQSIGLRKFDGPGVRAMTDYCVDMVRRLASFVRFVRHERPHIVQGFLYWPCILAVASAKTTRVPIVVSTRRSLNHTRDNRAGLRLLQKCANVFTDAVIANSVAVRDDAVRREGLVPSKITVILNGINRHRFDGSSSPLSRADLGAPRVGPTVAVIANLLAYKGHEVFLDAWRMVVHTHPDACAVLVGDGPLRSRLQQRAEQLGVSATVRFLGARPEVAPVLEPIDIVVHPSDEEGSSNAILEAMAAGKPVVATAVGGSVELVEHEQTGLLVAPHDANALAAAIGRLIENPEQAAAFGAAGHRRIEAQYDVDRMVAAHQDLYRALWHRKCPGSTVKVG
jgi:glycosyltransferase involved in cell wall biosynthesis